MIDRRGYELPTTLQNFRQNDLTEVKIFQNVLGGGATFLKHCTVQPPCATCFYTVVMDKVP